MAKIVIECPQLGPFANHVQHVSTHSHEPPGSSRGHVETPNEPLARGFDSLGQRRAGIEPRIGAIGLRGVGDGLGVGIELFIEQREEMHSFFWG